MLSTSAVITVDNTLGSCDYISLPMGSYQQSGFGQQPLNIYSTSAPSQYNQHTVKFMANDDPYIAASRITKGTFDFGLTAAQQRTIGIALLIAGILITIGVGCLLGALKQRMSSNPQNGSAVYGAFGRQYPQPYANPGVQYQQMPPPQQQQPYQQQYQAQPYQQQPYAAPPQQQPYYGGPQQQQQPYQQAYVGQPVAI